MKASSTRGAICFVAVSTMTSAMPLDSAAQSSTEDVIELRDGQTLRGHTVERRADGTLVFMLRDGEIRTLSPDQIVAPSNGVTMPPHRSEPDLSLQPLPGRAPLIVESNGAPLSVGPPGAIVGDVATVYGLEPRFVGLCMTPCSLYVRPGNVVFGTGGPDRGSYVATVRVPEGGLRVRMRSSSPAGLGVYTLIAGGGGGILLGVYALVAGGITGSGAAEIAGVILASAGATLLVIAIANGYGRRVGVESESPLAGAGSTSRSPRTPPRWSAGILPLERGMFACGAIHF